jgi:DNA polymerase-3 subunit epsilon
VRVKDYILFIDTETSGLPKKWNKPYSTQGNWPYSIQIAWIIFQKDGTEIKSENHYIKDNDFEIEASSLKIHGISSEFLHENGEKRKKVMSKLAYDIKKYKPMLVGHFLELDFHMLGVDFYRSGIENPTQNLPLFCTMYASAPYVKNPQAKYLRLSQLYTYLFNEKVDNLHNALTDAKVTALSFFEMLKRGEITEDLIIAQQSLFKKKKLSNTGKAWAAIFFISIITIILIIILFIVWNQD